MVGIVSKLCLSVLATASLSKLCNVNKYGLKPETDSDWWITKALVTG